MPARVLDGSEIARTMRGELRERVASMGRAGVPVTLDAVLTGDEDSPARLYAQNQQKQCEQVGIRFRLHALPSDASAGDIAGTIASLNNDADVTGIMLHLPVPEGVDAYELQRRIAPEKDIEGVNPSNIGNIVYGRSSLVPCTALAAMRLIEETGVRLRGKTAVVVGAGNVVGKPLAVLLMRAEATVISCNVHTPELGSLATRADVLIAAAGVPRLVGPELVREGAVVIDVGVNRIEQPDGSRMTCGDVDFEKVRESAGWISPVPGGVGPVTVATLLSNAVEAAALASGATPAEITPADPPN
ncbi:MAG: bifunctional 5,10-methylenetetrahydrofolate dehydrogenase/5,10-methenyltetrahydrofolate cyclohydrolase [Planctomycetota bacterium]